MEAPSAPSNFPVPAPINSLNPAVGGFGGRRVGLHSQWPNVRLSMWNWWPGQFTSRLLGGGPAWLASDPQWISKPCVTRNASVPPFACTLRFSDATNTLPPPVILPGDTHAKHKTETPANKTITPAAFSTRLFIVFSPLANLPAWVKSVQCKGDEDRQASD